MEISLILRELRTENGYTQKELAERLGITQDSISLWEKGKRIPDTPYVIALCNLFEVSADYLLGRSDDLGNVTVNGNTPALNAEEAELLTCFRSLAPSFRALAIQTLKTWAGENTGNSSTNRATH